MKEQFLLRKRISFPGSLVIGLACLILLSFLVLDRASVHAALPPPPRVDAKATMLINTNDGSVLLSDNVTKSLSMASTTKIMTAVVVLENAPNLDQLVTIKQEYIDYVIENNASNAGLVVGDRLTIRELLYALLLPSGADAGQALADTFGPGQSAFVQKMNEKANTLGMSQTHYANPDGLNYRDEEKRKNFSSASDILTLSQLAMQNSLFADVVKTAQFTTQANSTHQAYTWNNTNTLLTTYQGAIGIKTGFTAQAGYCLVFAATRNNQTLIGVLLHSPTSEKRFADAQALLDWGFSTLSL